MALSSSASQSVTGNRGRAAATVALRVADHRSKHVRLDVSVSPRIGSTLDELASQYCTTRAVVVRSMLRFALTNRDWKTQGLIWTGE